MLIKYPKRKTICYILWSIKEAKGQKQHHHLVEMAKSIFLHERYGFLSIDNSSWILNKVKTKKCDILWERTPFIIVLLYLFICKKIWHIKMCGEIEGKKKKHVENWIFIRYLHHPLGCVLINLIYSLVSR